MPVFPKCDQLTLDQLTLKFYALSSLKNFIDSLMLHVIPQQVRQQQQNSFIRHSEYLSSVETYQAVYLMHV